MLVVEKSTSFFSVALAAIFMLLLGCASLAVADPSAVDGTPPITGGEAEKQNIVPQAPSQILPHEAYVPPPDTPVALPTPAPEANSSASQSGASSASAALDGAGAEAASRANDREPTPGLLLFKRTRDLSFADPLSWSVMVYKSRHILVVYYKGRRYQTYHAVFGRNLDDGEKEYEGDRRTPEGVYTIIETHRSRRWRWFLTLNYPNLVDRLRYYELVDSDVIPIHNGHVVGVGGRIGIHGTDDPVLNHGNVNWTTGCISVDNDVIDQLHRLLPVGTIVIIKP